MAAKPATKRSTDTHAEAVRAARELVQSPIDVQDLLVKIGVRDNSAIARRLASAESPKRADAWRRLAAVLFSLANSRPKMVQRAVQFYIPDGKYQLQVFALDDAADGTLVVCCEDVLDAAVSGKLLQPMSGNTTTYIITGTRETLTIDRLDGKTENPPVYVNAMTGWNRKAIKITLPPDVSDAQLQAAEMVCAIASLRWQSATPTPAA